MSSRAFEFIIGPCVSWVSARDEHTHTNLIHTIHISSIESSKRLLLASSTITQKRRCAADEWKLQFETRSECDFDSYNGFCEKFNKVRWRASKRQVDRANKNAPQVLLNVIDERCNGETLCQTNFKVDAGFFFSAAMFYARSNNNIDILNQIKWCDERMKTQVISRF